MDGRIGSLVGDPPLAGRIGGIRVAADITALVAAVGLLTVGAWLSVPFYPVPMTMQTLSVLIVGGILGPKLGAAAVAGYLVLGSAGAPVFHGGLGGPLLLMGPTGGYLLGFLPMVLVMGLVAHRAPLTRRVGLGTSGRLVELAAGAVLAEAALYAAGVPWLAVLGGMSFGDAVGLGVAPFVVGDVLKIAVAVGAIRWGRTVLDRRGSLPS